MHHTNLVHAWQVLLQEIVTANQRCRELQLHVLELQNQLSCKLTALCDAERHLGALVHLQVIGMQRAYSGMLCCIPMNKYVAYVCR